MISRYIENHSFPANQKCVMFSCILLQNELDNTNSCYQLFMTIAISGKKKHIMKCIWENIYGRGIVWLQL